MSETTIFFIKKHLPKIKLLLEKGANPCLDGEGELSKEGDNKPSAWHDAPNLIRDIIESIYNSTKIKAVSSHIDMKKTV
ncbi:MAG: hypothetical protein NMK33_05220 [Candidatus Cardinium sp.]|uniref:hypothetical protein n=1 Tax=Cardinium endosymbiont of Dermatophagoides farinae TaxID=2597823 RepID=UPI0011820F11|nr:hypothetical protein [Cardinium endosymbiont of Dermatophagoides farinae]TSJ80816.1 hypothetical protein FPG78_02015 [Cardinium endosymbiont of Dermatophagoides farinae]UWW96819.1 MAG: hypothetical protein NMK33_05220 [Candidatus Cardinium sp.]